MTTTFTREIDIAGDTRAITAHISVTDGSFDYSGTHCNAGIPGTHKQTDYEVVTFSWDEASLSPQENAEIFEELTEDWDRLSESFIYHYQESL